MSSDGIPPDALANAMFLLLTMVTAGVVHVWWLSWARSGPLMQPLDRGLTYKERRIFGDNKRLRGLVVMPAAAAASFWLVWTLREMLPAWLARGLWDLRPGQYVLLGFAAGLAFMLAELPNSFLKRRLGVPPGQMPHAGWARLACPLLDRVDSVLGTLIVVSLLVPVSGMTWVWVLLIGPGLHAIFSSVLFRLRVKERAL